MARTDIRDVGETASRVGVIGTLKFEPSSNPLAFFAAEIKRLRAKHGITQEQLAKDTASATATVAAIEQCRRLPSAGFAIASDKTFGTDYLTGLQELVIQTCALPMLRDLLEVEQQALEIRTYASHVVPGLLQTENYMRSVIPAGRPILPKDDIERAVALRLTRQEILEHEAGPAIAQIPSPQFWFVLDESILHRIVASQEAMKQQREHLIAMAMQPNVTMQVIPYSQGVTSAYGRAFMILVSNSGSVVYLEDIRSARYARDRDEVGRYVITFDHLRAAALDENASIELIRGVDI